MSLESGIADLTKAASDLIATFNGKNAAINTALTAALLAVPVNKKTYYVDYVAGSDANDGKLATPFKTIDKAIASTPYGGICTVLLISDYDMMADIAVEGVALQLASSVSGTKRKINPKIYQYNGSSESRLAAFSLQTAASAALKDMSIVFPSVTGLSSAPAGGPNTFFRGSQSGQAPLIQIKLLDSEVVDVPGANAVLAYAPTSAMLLEAYNTTFPSGFGGRYIFGMASGSQASSNNNVLTNLTTF